MQSSKTIVARDKICGVEGFPSTKRDKKIKCQINETIEGKKTIVRTIEKRKEDANRMRIR